MHPRSLAHLAVLLTALGAGAAAGAAQAPAKPAAPASKAAPPAKAAAPALTMPPIPNPGFQPPRPMPVMHEVYKFAASHPEVLKFVPCYCGCGAEGHPHNESCFVKRRDAKGNVTEWDTHGFG
jgi:hypothetical protein